ncbi:MAG: anti-sigma factor family protein [Massilia sp.]
MNFSDETLMAYADGELGEPARSQVERAIRLDPSLAARVAQHKAMRARVSTAFASIVNEAVPPRLYPGAANGKVVHLNAVRAARHQQQTRDKPGWDWRQWGALAASLVVGVLAGVLGSRALQDDGRVLAVSGKDGALVAQGQLAHALSQQLASSATSGSNVRIGVSFVAKDNAYCRSFAVGASAGLACMQGGHWTIPVLEEGAAGAPGAYRQATSEVPAAVLTEIDQRIAGAALGADDERMARQRGWRR